MEIAQLLTEIANRFKEKMGTYPSRTKLLKLTYLAELFHTRLAGELITDTKWIFWKFGPYIPDYNKLLLSDAFKKDSSEDDFKPVVPSQMSIKDYKGEINSALTEVEDFFDMDLDALLDFVYFDTEPMIHASNRGDTLDFSKVKPDEFYRVKKLRISNDRGKLIKKRIQEWKEKHA